jgi:hypothetical protein
MLNMLRGLLAISTALRQTVASAEAAAAVKAIEDVLKASILP